MLIENYKAVILTSEHTPRETVYLDALLCLVSRLQAEVFDNIFRIKMFPVLCDQYRNKTLPSQEVERNLKKFRPHKFNSAFCSEGKSRYGIPWKILGMIDAYESSMRY